MSFGNEDDVVVDGASQQDLEEVRSAHGASSCSVHESNSSDAASCSQSDISLCDDGGSEGEEGEGDHILGHLTGGA